MKINSRLENPRFDVNFREHVPSIDYHYCREWDGDTGCYGTNESHGMSFSEAKQCIIDWHKEEIVRMSILTLEEWQGEACAD